MPKVISIDIGSTHTKGALFSREGSKFRLLKKASTPTTVAHLANGFFAVHQELSEGNDYPVYFSSSAKGGLSIAAIGLVPELTLKTARLTALSAGGKITSVYSYKLSRKDVENLEHAKPDIVLLVGGTDGGNESYVLHNATALAARDGLREKTTILYAGNAAIAENVEHIFKTANFDIRVVCNILPEIDRFEPGEARDQIRDIFLQKIVCGKGLDEIVRHIGRQPFPTPYAVFELVRAIHKNAPDFGEFILIDMGGATTDVYSSASGHEGKERIIYRGIREPVVKRTVEGDLGMRVSAGAAVRSAEEYISSMIGEDEKLSFDRFLEKISKNPGIIGQTEQELRFDRILASACIRHSVTRHAGTFRRVFTALGETFIQSGKDLRQVRKLIGSGGYLSAMSSFAPLEAILHGKEHEGEHIPLIPLELTYYRDRDYLFPLLGNLVGEHEKFAVETALDSITS